MNSIALVFFHLLLATAFRMNSAGCPGCTSPVSDPNTSEIRKVMSSTLGKTNAGYTLNNVKSCETQVVAGVKYDCEIEVKSPSGQLENCHLVVVQRPWDKNDKEQIVSETCSSLKRAKRAICAGCPVDQDANSAEMKKSLSGVLDQTNSGLSLVRGDHCTAQVVAGIRYRCDIQVESPKTNGVQKCHLDFVERAWEHQTEIMSDTCSQLVRNKREVCAGCPVDQDANSAEMKKTLSGVLDQTNSGLSLVRGDHCTSQVVAGIRYRCDIQVESPKTNGVQKCHLDFVERAWKHQTEIISDTCSQLVRNKREVCAGCPIDQDANSAEMKKKLSGVLDQTNSGLSLVRGVHCTSQVVDGARYRCEIEVESPKTNGVQKCHLDFVERPWKHQTDIISDTCSQLVRNKREICAGCPVDQDPNDPEIKKTLTNSLSHTNSGLTLAGVDKCTTQVVSGILYDCTIRVESPYFNGVQTCRLQILDHPWVTKDPEVVYDSCSKLTNKA